MSIYLCVTIQTVAIKARGILKSLVRLLTCLFERHMQYMLVVNLSLGHSKSSLLIVNEASLSNIKQTVYSLGRTVLKAAFESIDSHSKGLIPLWNNRLS